MKTGRRWLSRLVTSYYRHVPLSRGKARLLYCTRSFLTVKTADGFWFRVTGVSGLEWEILRGEVKEPQTQLLVRSLVTAGMTVVDVGANVGWFALLASRLVGPSGRVIAIEPTPSVNARLQENARLNGATNLVTLGIAVSDVVGSAEFFINPTEDDSEGNSLVQGATTPGATAIQVEQSTLDQIISSRGLPRVDLVKIDVEGNELRVLRGAAALLRSPDAPLLLIEVNPLTLAAAGSQPDDLYRELTQLDYQWKVVEEIPWKTVTTLNILAWKQHCQRIRQ